MKSMKNSFISANPPLISLTFSPRNSPRIHCLFSSASLSSLFLLSLVTSLAFLGILFLILTIPTSHYNPQTPCSLFSSENEPRLSNNLLLPLPVHELDSNLSDEEREFWKQPDDEGYLPCLDFSIGYRRRSAKISKEKRRFLMVVVSGGIHQQRNQIVDAVVVARILEAALVVPVLKVNHLSEDESEFSEIFDVEHFRRTLVADVRVISSLPSTHLIPKQTIETQLPSDVSPGWICARFSRLLKEEGLLILKGLDSKLSKNLPPDLQKLRCKIAFHALRFAHPIQEIGNLLARRMWIEGPYIALHLQLEKEIWTRTGCLTGLGQEYDEIISKERDSRSEFLTGRSNMSHIQQRLAGLCPLHASEMTRLLKALGAPNSARVYISGGKPFGDAEALKPLIDEYPNMATKEMLAREGELSSYVNRSLVMAAIDYIVSLSSDVFLPSHGGNMARFMQGHRTYVGHRKYIKPNKRQFVRLAEELASKPNTEFGEIMKKIHRSSLGQPEPRTNKRDRDVIAYPVPECMCNRRSSGIFRATH